MTEKIDYKTWMEQPLLWAERCRGRSLVWTPEANWFINDPLGPVPHTHDDASEIVFLAQGSMEIEVGASKRLYKPGDFLLMPPNKFHNYWFKGEDPVCLFVVVAPNHKYHRFRTKDFPAGAHEGDAPYANVWESSQLPSDEYFLCERKTLAPGASEALTALPLKDRVLYILKGTAHLTVGTLAGTLAANQYQYIPATVRHQISNPGFEPLHYFSLTITDPFTAHGTEPKEE